MMEKLGAPQTHLGLKAMIKEVGKSLNQYEFILQKYILIPSYFRLTRTTILPSRSESS